MFFLLFITMTACQTSDGEFANPLQTRSPYTIQVPVSTGDGQKSFLPIILIIQSVKQNDDATISSRISTTPGRDRNPSQEGPRKPFFPFSPPKMSTGVHRQNSGVIFPESSEGIYPTSRQPTSRPCIQIVTKNGSIVCRQLSG